MKFGFSWFFLLTSVCLSSAEAGRPPTGRYKAALDILRQIQKNYSQYSSLINLGANEDGVDIVGIRVSVTPTQIDPRKVGHLVVGTHHGNELKATEFTLAFTQSLLKRYAGRALFSSQLADTEWTIIPVLNVPGYNYAVREERGIDSNREYPGPCHDGPSARLASVRHMMNLLRVRPFAGAVTVHGYIGTLTFPWGVGTNNTHTHDHNAYDRIFAKAASLNGYRYGTSTDLIYPASGTFEDYVYWKHGVWSALLELKDGSPRDIQASVAAIHTFFDQIDSTPSKKHQFTGSCTRTWGPDLAME